MRSKADLHVHSKHSDRPSEWFLRRIGAPESFTEPLEVYRRCLQRGMDFVTLSDHNCIDGALEIAHLPNTFISNEVTTYFPEDGCKIHCLVTGITEAQFKVIQDVRQNIYDFQQYLLDENIVYSVAHPLYSVNDRLTINHVEKLLLLFNRFEGINGARHPRAADLVNAVFRSLTPEMINAMADAQGIAPHGPTPWRKTFTGGSDDHGGVYIASAYTTTPKADNVAQFLQFLREGDHEMSGASGTSLRLAHSFYQIAYSYYKARFLGGNGQPRNPGGMLISEFFKILTAESVPSPRKTGIVQRVRSAAQYVVRPLRKHRLSPADRNLVEDFTRLFGDAPANDFQPEVDEKSFDVACKVCHELGYRFIERFMRDLQKGHFLESLQAMASLAPMAMSIAPYIAAFRTQHKDEAMLQGVARHFESAHNLVLRSQRKAWIASDVRDDSPLARMIARVAAVARPRGRQLSVITCQEQTPDLHADVRNFAPVGRMRTSDYDFQKLSFPPFLSIIEYIESQQFCELMISTPDALGLTALAAGRLLGIKVTAVYHADFAQRVRQVTEDETLEAIAVRYSQWFFDQAQTILVPDDTTRQQLIDEGQSPAKLVVVPALDVDDAEFESFWSTTARSPRHAQPLATDAGHGEHRLVAQPRAVAASYLE